MNQFDRHKMIRFISSQLLDGKETLPLASGPEGTITADIEMDGDELLIDNCPDWVDVREVYDHLRWRAMPSWEQRSWLRAEPVAVYARVLENRRLLYDLLGNDAPYRLQKVGEMWVVHFTVEDHRSIGIFGDHRGLQHYAALLARPDRQVASAELAGEATAEAMTVMASERNRTPERASGNLTPDVLRAALRRLEEEYAAAKERGDLDGMEDAEDKIQQFRKQVGSSDKEFERHLRQEDQERTLSRTIHRTVATALRRALQTLKEGHMGACADFLARHVRPEGRSFAYRPPLISPPKWQL
jgi:hypothetical protein